MPITFDVGFEVLCNNELVNVEHFNYVHQKAESSEYRIKVKYTTPQKYFKDKCRDLKDHGSEFPSRKGDFFPYADFPHAYWTGTIS